MYQRRLGLLQLCAIAFACGCDGTIPAAPTTELSPRQALPSAIYLESRSYDLIGLDGDPPRVLATEYGPDGPRAVAISLAGQVSALLARDGAESRALAAHPAASRSFVERVDALTGEHRWIAIDRGGRSIEWSGGIGTPERLLGWSLGGRHLLTARRSADGGADQLLETATSTLAQRQLDAVPAPLWIAAVSEDAQLLALKRSVNPEADEVVVRDRVRGEDRLLLPDGPDGRFEPLAFAARGRALLVLTDDRSDLPRLERIDLVTRVRRPLSSLFPECAATGVGTMSAGALDVELLCRGRREVRRVSWAGASLPLPPTPSATRWLRGISLPRGGLAVWATAGEGWASDLWVERSGADLRPLTYGLAPRIRPTELPESESIAIPGNPPLPAELWQRSIASRAGLIWLDDAEASPRWGEHDPLFSALSARGIAVLRYRARGSERFGRQLRRAADDDPAGAALDDAVRAHATLRQRLPGRPILFVGEGARSGAVALAVATLLAEGPTAVAALFPDPDPFAPRVAGPEAWRFPVSLLRRPTLVLLDLASTGSAELTLRIAAARAGGSDVEGIAVRRSSFTGRPLADGAARLVAFADLHSVLPAAAPSKPR